MGLARDDRSAESWQRVWAVFEEVVERPSEEQAERLERLAKDDPGLRRAVEEMLAADRRDDSLLDRPIADPRGTEPPEAAAPEPLSPGAIVGPYRVLRRVGQGGMSTVYLAVRADDAFRRRVVIKLVRPGMETASVIERLRTERQILASLDHPYIARLYDGGTTRDGLPYFVMEYVDGVAIDAYCDENRLSVDERLRLFHKVCAAVRTAHQSLIVHRDLKPSNILVTASGDPKLLDFGIAKLLNPELVASGLEPTATWHRLLTPNYASPEQLRGQLITTSSDVYSLGVLLYKLLTGRLPYRFSGRSMTEVERLLDETEPTAPSVAVDETPAEAPAGVSSRQLAGDLDAIVSKALRAAPGERYGSVEELAADVERHQLGLPVEARPPSWRYRAGKFARRNRGPLALVAAAALVLVGFTVAMFLQAARVTAERDLARGERDKKGQVLALVLDLFRLANPYVVPGEELTVREALERSVPLLEEGLEAQPAVRAELLHASGSILTVLGRYEDAAEQLAEALELRRRLHGEEHLDVAASLSALAAARKETGELEEAEDLARRAVALSRRLLGDGHPDLIAPLNELVSVLCYRSEYEAAAGLAHESLELARALPDGSAREIAALEHLALVRSEQGELRDAVRLNREALALRRASRGERHPGLVNALNNLGFNLRHLGELEAAERTYREALDIHRESFGDGHDDPYLLNNLAGVRAARGAHGEAETLYREAREAVVGSSGERHWMVFFFDLKMAEARILQGEPAVAEKQLRALLERWRPILLDHWRLDEGATLLGKSLSAQGRCSEAEPLLVSGFERLLEKAGGRVLEVALERLDEHFERCGRPQETARYRAMLEAKTG